MNSEHDELIKEKHLRIEKEKEIMSLKKTILEISYESKKLVNASNDAIAMIEKSRKEIKRIKIFSSVWFIVSVILSLILWNK